MVIRLVTATALALGIMSPLAFAGDNAAYRCDGFLPSGVKAYECGGEVATTSVQPFAAFEETARIRGPGPVGDYVDETPAESNQRSGND